MAKKDLTVIGNNVLVNVAGIKKVPAKVDTGANLSSIWASNIRINDSKHLEFTLFGPSSPFYTGEVITAENFRTQRVLSSIGEMQVRYRVSLPVTIKHRRILATFTLADRSRNKFPILIGRRTLIGKFIVDVSKIAVEHSHPIDTSDLDSKLDKDPQSFDQSYMQKSH